MQRDELIKFPEEKLLPYPLSLKFWTHDFTGIPDFRFPDSYHCLVGKDGYDEDCLRSYKSLEGFGLFTDRHVEDLKYHDFIDDGTDKTTELCYFQFIVLFFESFFFTNFVILKDVAGSFSGSSVETRKIWAGSTSLVSSLPFRFLRSLDLFSR